MSILNDRHFVFNFWLIFIIAVLHNSASFFYFYWTVWWFDILMHFLGGFWITSVFLWLFFGSYFNRLGGVPTRGKVFAVAILSAIIMGFLWEVFEWATDIILFPEWALDSVYDLVMDIVGGFFAYIYYWRKNKSANGR